MFEQYTYEYLLNDVLKNAPDDIDTRQGSIFYDAVSGPLLKIAKLYTDLDMIESMASIRTATGDALDTRAEEHGLTRLSATKAKYKSEFEGTTPAVGERFYYDGAYFTLVEAVEDGHTILVFEAETPGEAGNDIYSGTPAVPVNNIPGLVSATFKEIFENGSDAEKDSSFRTRIYEKIAGPAENGNRQHYKTWCESIDGVGQARIFPLWNGENTVKAVLIDPTGKPCSEEKVQEVQKYIDPADKGMTVEVEGKKYTKGDGLGNGVANIGAHFTAVAATALSLTVSFTAVLRPGGSSETVQRESKEAIEEYLRGLVLDTPDGESCVVRISAIGAMLTQVKDLLDYTGLKINGGSDNITPTEEEVPVLEEVQVS